MPCDTGRYAALILPIPCCRGDKPSRRHSFTVIGGDLMSVAMLRGADSMACGAVGTTTCSFPFRFDAIPFPRVLIRGISSAVACKPGALKLQCLPFPSTAADNDI